MPWDEGCTVRDGNITRRSRKKAVYAAPTRRVVGFCTAGTEQLTECQDPVPSIIRSAYSGLL